MDRPVDPARDHLLGHADAKITLLEYGSYTCPRCHAAHAVIANLRDRFGDDLSYVFRHRPSTGSAMARKAAEIAECAAAVKGEFWPVHDLLMQRGPDFAEGELDDVARDLGLPPESEESPEWRAARRRVDEDASSAATSGARFTPTFFINGRRYEGAWDERALGEAMVGSLGQRLQTAQMDFVHWGPSSGVLLLLMSSAAIVAFNSPFGPAFAAFWERPFEIGFGAASFGMPLIDWINDGLLTLFFLVVGLEIKRELTVGRLATPRAAALPIAAAFGGMLAPALIYVALAPSALGHGWGVPIATDTAFALALLTPLGARVPVELRVFLTAAVIVDDLVAILVVALFYSSRIDLGFLLAAAAVTAALVVLARVNIYRALPYALLGVLLWICLHASGVHATLAGVVLAICVPTRPPPNLHALTAQIETLIADEMNAEERVMRHGLSEPALRHIDAIYDRLESPASKVLRRVEPWSSYVVLPAFALANAGVLMSAEVFESHGALMSAIILGLAAGKPLGIVASGALAVRLGIAEKPAAYGWLQLAGAGVVAGMGFTMSLFIATQAFPQPSDFAAAKIAIFIASLIAGIAGAAILWFAVRPAQNDG